MSWGGHEENGHEVGLMGWSGLLECGFAESCAAVALAELVVTYRVNVIWPRLVMQRVASECVQCFIFSSHVSVVVLT